MSQLRNNNKHRTIVPAEEIDNHWAISYGDMITLLLGFFVLFFNINDESYNLKLIKKEFSKISKNETQKDLKGLADRKYASIGNLNQKDDIKAEHISANLEKNKLIIEFPQLTFFNKGKYKLTDQGRDALLRFAKIMKDKIQRNRLIIRGYTDNSKVIPGKTPYKDNLELSALRSIAAIRYLSTEGIPLNQMRVAGYSETDLSNRQTPEQQAALDRKIVIVIEPLDDTERGFKNIFKKVKKVSKKETLKKEATVKKSRGVASKSIDKGFMHDELVNLSKTINNSTIYKKINQYILNFKNNKKESQQ